MATPHPTSLTLGHLKVNCLKGAREATLGCLLKEKAFRNVKGERYTMKATGIVRRVDE